MVRQVLQYPDWQYTGRFSDLVHWFGTYLLGRSQPILGRLLRTRADVEFHKRRERKCGIAPLAMIAGILRFIPMLTGARISGAYKRTPLFSADTGSPVVAPKVLSPSERDAVYAAV